jgi:hypothetical protein
VSEQDAAFEDFETGSSRKREELRNDRLHNLYSGHNIITVIE